MSTTTLELRAIGEIVANDFRAAAIFKNAGIDFGCGGNKSLKDACQEKDIDPTTIASKIEELSTSEPDHAHDFKNWDIGFLCDYIVNTHHRFVLKNLPELVFYTGKIASVHGENHSELTEVAQLFQEIEKELRQHLRNEEEVLFPAIKIALQNGSSEAKKTIISEITRMTGEHEFAGGAMDKINEITKGYRVPADGCNTYQVAFKMLEAFEDDLHIHVHLENNILFPKALQLAK